MRVQEVHFNFPGSGAILLRQNNTPNTVIRAPEWVDGKPSQPAAYARSAAPSPLFVKVRFADGPANETRQIRAVPPDQNWSNPFVPLFGFQLFGQLGTRSVSFDSNGVSGLVDFVVTGNLATASVRITTVSWIWQWRQRSVSNQWQQFDATQHRIFVLAAPPTPPWRTVEAVPDDTQVPWVDALHKACAWAAGRSTPDSCTAAVAEKINRKATQHYDVNARNNYVNSEYEFNLTGYLRDWDHSDSFNVDCLNTATALITFANLLGADLRPIKIADNGADMVTELVRPLSKPNDESGWISITNWKWHEVAFRNSTMPASPGGGNVGGPTVSVGMGLVPEPGGSSLLTIVDACLHVVRTADIFPVLVPLGVSTPGGGYRDQLLRSGQAAFVTPKPHRPVY